MMECGLFSGCVNTDGSKEVPIENATQDFSVDRTVDDFVVPITAANAIPIKAQSKEASQANHPNNSSDPPVNGGQSVPFNEQVATPSQTKATAPLNPAPLPQGNLSRSRSDDGVIPQPTSQGVKAMALLKRGLSNFSAGSFGSKPSNRSSASLGSSSRSTSKSGSAARRWSTMLDNPAVSGVAKRLGVILKDDERMINYDLENSHAIVSPTSVNEARNGRPNKIRTTKFTPLTWLPLSLLNQFQRVANIYFLFIACLVVWPWSPKDWKSKIFPFIAVLLWTALKDLYEDVRRKRDDDAENTQRVWRFNRTGNENEEEAFEEVAWSEVYCGDIVLIPEDAAFPADLLLLHPAGGTEAFISTVMLDGETSLKVRQPPSICEVMASKCSKNAPSEWQQVQSAPKEGFPLGPLQRQMNKFLTGLRRPGVELKFPSPTPVLADVRGTLQLMGNEEGELVCPFTEDNFLPRGCILRNTPFILGVCIFVGDDTKTRLNASTSKMKFSNMQKNLNNCVRGMLVGLFSMCLVATVIAFADQGGLAEKSENLIEDAQNPLIRFFMFCVTFYHVVPMSLYVVYEMLKLVLAFQVNTDKQMYDEVRGDYALARTAEVMEEMGQVNFMFSDKTGTLTANEMVFARCHVAEEDVGEFRKTSEGDPGDGMKRARQVLEGGKSDDPLFKSLLNLFTCLAVCHSVQVVQKPQEDKGGAPVNTYNGMSPDEVALVQAAHDVGISFESRVRKNAGNTSELVLKGPSTSERKFTILHELAFSSDRKRMSVVVKHKGSIWVITKGADSVMEPLLANGFSERCNADLSTFSRQGLRTLIVGMRSIDESEFDEWSVEYTAARNLIDETKESKMAEVGAKLEKNLKFIGVTAVEDRLQDGVPETISIIKQAGIRVWVLTGDKTETAVDIAKSCQLFTDTTTMAYAVGATDAKDAEDRLLKAHSSLDGQKDTGLVLDGQTLIHALNSMECRKIIYDLGVVSRSCICSRLSPMQKLELVKLVREQNRLAITLAIGDGANDVPMIQGAHLGIAIRGKEGTQAVQASDIAISYFRFLVPLLFCHGRRAYRRVALFLCFYLYKNAALLMCDVIWMFQDKFRARIAFPEYLSVGYNVLYSTWHLLFVLGFDRDIPDEIANATPGLYKVGPSRQLFNMRLFSRWMLFGVLQGSIAWIVPYSMIGTSEYDKTQPMDFWICSTVAFTTINIIAWSKLLLYCESPCALTSTLSTAGAVLCYIFCVGLLSYSGLGKSFQPSMWHVPGDVMSDSKNMIAILAAWVAAMAPDVVYLLVATLIWPSELTLAKRSY